MAGIIPKRKIKGVDFCGTSSHYYIIRSDLGCYMRSSNFHRGSDLSIHALHPSCQHGDHYLADKKRFYIIKGDECCTVTDLSKGTDSTTFTLDSKCRGGDHYLAADGWFYIIFQRKGTYRRTSHLSKDSGSGEITLHPDYGDGLYYWGLPNHYCFLKPASKWGVEYYKGTSLKKYKRTAIYSIHPDVLSFLPGGLSITNGPAFGRWENIKTISNDRPSPVTWTKKVTKKVGYNKEKMSKITENWKIEKSATISSGKLARLIANAEFTLLGLYRGSSVNTEPENWTEETEDEELLSFDLKPNQCLHVWQYQLGLGSKPVLFCQDLKITDTPDRPTEVLMTPVNTPAQQSLQEISTLIMKAADLLCKSLFHWLENRKDCAGELKKLAQELEDHQRSNIAQGGGAATPMSTISIREAFISGKVRVASVSTAKEEDFSSSAFDKATELIKEDEDVGKNIQKQLRDLKYRSGEELKDRSGEASLRARADELDCEVTTQLMSALARSRMTLGGPAAAEVSDFICQALRLDSFPEITSGLKISGKELIKNIELIGIKASVKSGSRALGVIGLGISLYDLIVTSERANRSGITEASEFLWDSAGEICDGQLKLKEPLDAMQEIIHKLFIMKSLIKDLGEYSLHMTEKVERIMDYIRRTCTDDRVVSWLEGKTHSIEFVNLLRFFLKRFGPIPEYLTKPGRGHIHIVIVAHGGIVDRFMPAGVLVPTPTIADTILYSPWNCSIDAKAAYAIAKGSIKPAHRKWNNIAHCKPNPLPDHWNSMRASQTSRHNIPEILLSPVTRKDGAWKEFHELMQKKGLEINKRVIIPYLVPEEEVDAFGRTPLYMFIFLTSFILNAFDKKATVHLAACLSRVQLVRQYAYTRDGMCMTVRIDDEDSELFRALRSLFDTTNKELESDPEQFNA